MSDHEKEKCTDPSDIATQAEMERNQSLLNEIRSRTKRTQEPNRRGRYAIVDCVECDNEIGEGRLKHAIKNTLCIECATAAERRR